jgi:hypothetical protein
MPMPMNTTLTKTLGKEYSQGGGGPARSKNAVRVGIDRENVEEMLVELYCHESETHLTRVAVAITCSSSLTSW